LPLTAPDGSTRVTVVSGSTLTGLYAPDGSLYVVVDDSSGTGAYHPCGALRVKAAPAGSPNPLRGPDGSIYVSDHYNEGGLRVTPIGTPIAFNTTYTLQTPVKLDSYDADTGFTVVGANATKALDQTAKIEGTGSMKVTNGLLNQTTGLTKSYGTKTTNTLGTMAYYTDRVTGTIGAQAVQVLVGAGNTQLTFTNEGSFLPGGRWVSFNYTELVNALASGTLQVSPRFTGGALSSAMRFDALYSNCGGRPTIVPTFDDGYDTIISTAFPILQERGFRATHFVAPDLLGTTGKMVEANLDTLYDAGWDLGCDSTDDTAFTAMADTATALADINEVRTFLSGNGWTRGMNHGCWPNGTFSAALATAFSGDGFHTMRTTEPQTFYTRFGVPPGIAMSHPSKGFTSSTTVASVLPLVDEAITRGNTLFLHFHDIKDTPSSIGWQTSKFTQLWDYIASKANQNLVDVLTVSQWWARDGSATPP
jgi:Predicted xylanase/chitin deacetylase